MRNIPDRSKVDLEKEHLEMCRLYRLEIVRRREMKEYLESLKPTRDYIKRDKGE
jgi:hypothetical protein